MIARNWILKPRKALFLTCLLSLLVLAVACGDDATSTPLPTIRVIPTLAPTETPVPTPVPDLGMLSAPEANAKYGGTLKWGGLASSTFLDIHQSASISVMGPQAPMYDLLVQVDPVLWSSIIPDLAKDWEISDDELTYTFFLRDGVKFHDGAALTAEDVAASFNQIIFPPEGVLSPRKGIFEAVKEVVATDNLTVEFRLRDPRGFMLRAIAGGFNVIVRKQTLDDNNSDLRKIPDYPGTGPFRYVSFEPKVQWTVEKNPDYWNPDLPYLDGIETFALGVGPATAAACLANEVDFCFLMGPAGEKEGKTKAGFNTARLLPTSANGFLINHNSEGLSDSRVRQAIQLVLDKPALLEAVSDMSPVLSGGWLMPTDPGFDAYWSQAKDQAGWRSPTDADIADAQGLMKDAGFEDGIKGLEFLVRQPVAHWVTWAPIIQDILKRQLKIESELKTVDSGPFAEALGAGNFDLTITGLNATLPNVADYWANWLGTGGGYNTYGYSSLEFDAVVAASTTESDPQKLKALIDQGTAILDDEVPLVIISGAAVVVGWWDYVKGHGAATQGGNYWEGKRKEIWWLDK